MRPFSIDQSLQLNHTPMQTRKERRKFLKNAFILMSSTTFIGGGAIKSLTEVNSIPLPYYRANAPMRRYLGITECQGQALSISGKIFSKTKHQCLKDTLIEVWQCDEKGHFDMYSSAYAGRASIMTNSSGAFAFDTNLPGMHTLNNVKQMRKIFFRIKHPGHETFYSQLLFDSFGHAYIDGNHWDKCLDKDLACPKNSGDEKQRNIEFNICLLPVNSYFS
jgi:protocatechuate 3,4-dioxygenase beta subunit